MEKLLIWSAAIRFRLYLKLIKPKPLQVILQVSSDDSNSCPSPSISVLKGTIHLKMKMLSSFTNHRVIPNYFCGRQKKMNVRNMQYIHKKSNLCRALIVALKC